MKADVIVEFVQQRLMTPMSVMFSVNFVVKGQSLAAE